MFFQVCPFWFAFKLVCIDHLYVLLTRVSELHDLKWEKKNSPLCKSVFNQTGMLLHQLVPIQTGCWEIHSWKCRPQPVHTPDLRLLCNQPLKWDNNVRVEWWCSLQILQCPQEQVSGWNITLTVALFSIINNKSVQGTAAVLAWMVKWYSNNF